MICPICSDILPTGLTQLVPCAPCLTRVKALDYSGTISVNRCTVHSAFVYKSIVRELVLRAKVQNSAVAVGVLVRLLADGLAGALQKYNSDEHLVISAPSSLRSRICGRFDLAQALGLSLFPRAGRIRGPMPGALLRPKRAGRNRTLAGGYGSKIAHSIPDCLKNFINFSDKVKRSNDICREISSGRPILVVDDVLTTGFTMGTLFDQLRMLGAQKIEGFVVAAPAIVVTDPSLT